MGHNPTALEDPYRASIMHADQTDTPSVVAKNAKAEKDAKIEAAKQAKQAAAEQKKKAAHAARKHARNAPAPAPANTNKDDA
eukprot:5528320-Pleurochrysis_carterae.AAC.2